MKINICGIPHKIKYCEDEFDGGNTHYGQVDYGKAEIKISKNVSEEQQEEALCHEVIHAIFAHIGRNDLAENETLVQSLANAVYQSFEARVQEGGEKE